MENYDEYKTQQLSGKRVLVTGGTTGIGRATAILLATLGAKVLVFGRHRQELDDTLASVADDNISLSGIVADASRREDLLRVFEHVDSELGGLDILINNVALPAQSIVDTDFEHRDYILQTNLASYMSCAQLAIDRMKSDGGHIVNVGSMSAEVREKGSSLYVATKSAIEGLSASLRKEVNEMGIKVTLIEPGATATDMQGNDAEKLAEKTRENEMLTANDVAVAIAYALCQPKRCDVVLIQLRPHLQLI
ncbi:SDR family oxidoreductase [Flavobacterium selenitireducens]|uniref:SDR family oxidoreductase n=1 Tax=Flavobacterium selenitireducens TaxID=2722704 RepID=UPI00168BDE02|nr:SDR family oxidoreductase [Flavobacterium selenitireducens]MBD3582206.1 SDR family oxidoreductase [Flavobacterium selenitireducens]